MWKSNACIFLQKSELDFSEGMNSLFQMVSLEAVSVQSWQLIF